MEGAGRLVMVVRLDGDDGLWMVRLVMMTLVMTRIMGMSRVERASVGMARVVSANVEMVGPPNHLLSRPVLESNRRWTSHCSPVDSGSENNEGGPLFHQLHLTWIRPTI